MTNLFFKNITLFKVFRPHCLMTLYRCGYFILGSPELMELYGYRENFCFPTSSFIYLFNNIFNFSADKYRESRIPLPDTSRYPITFTTETYCYTRPVPSTVPFNQQSLNTGNIEFGQYTAVPFQPFPSSVPFYSSNIFTVAR